MHSSKHMPRLPKAKQQASLSSTTKQERQRHHSIVQEPNLSAGIPVIDIPKLVGFLQSLGIAAVEADLLQPNSRRTREMCELLLRYFVPHRMEALKIEKERITVEFTDTLEISTENAEALPVYRELQMFLEKIAFRDFTIAHILDPKTHRLQRMLSSVYNYKLFRDSATTQFDILAQDSVDKTALCEAHAAKKEASKTKIIQLKAKREAEQKEVQEWEAKNQEAEQIVRQLRKEGDAILKDIDAYKSERHQLKDTLQETQFAMINVIEYVRALKQYELMDVEALKNSMSELSVNIQKYTEEVSHMDENYDKVEEAAKDTKSIHNHLTKDIPKIESLTKLKADVNRQQKTNEAVQKHYQVLVARKKDQRTKLQLCHKTLHTYNDRLRELANQREKKIELVERTYRDIEEQKKALQQECESREKERKKYILDTEKIAEKENTVEANHQHFMRQLYLEMQAVMENIAEVYQQTQAIHV